MAGAHLGAQGRSILAPSGTSGGHNVTPTRHHPSARRGSISVLSVCCFTRRAKEPLLTSRLMLAPCWRASLTVGNWVTAKMETRTRVLACPDGPADWHW